MRKYINDNDYTLERFIVSGELEERKADLINQLITITRGNKELIQELIDYRQIEDTEYYINALSHIIRKKPTGEITELKHMINDRGYNYVEIKGKAKKVHRLLADNFLIPEEGMNQINHIDKNRNYNPIWNLERVTGSFNMKHSSEFDKGMNSQETNAIDIFLYKLDLKRIISLTDFKKDTIKIKIDL